MSLGMNLELLERVNEKTHEFFQSHRAGPGLSVGIMQEGSLVSHLGCGSANVEQGYDVDRASVFRIASMSKSFTAAAILMLRDAGELTLESRIQSLIPDFAVSQIGDFGGEELTVRHCLTMSGGLPSDDPWADRQEAMSDDDFTHLVSAGIQFQSVPGTRFEYSSLSFAILGRVIENVSGLSYQEFLEQRIFAPLNLQETFLDFAKVPEHQLAMGYSRATGERSAEPFTGPGAFSAIGGILSTPSDIAVWTHWLSQALAEKSSQNSDPGILSLESRREMQQMHRVVGVKQDQETVEGYGYGLFIEESVTRGKIVHHLGGYPGFGSSMRWHPVRDIGVVAFGNTKYAPVTELTESILHLILDEIDAPTSKYQPDAELLQAQEAVTAVLCGDDLHHRAAIFSSNVLQDLSAEERNKQHTRILTQAGVQAPEKVHGLRSNTPVDLEWEIPGANENVSVSVQLTPTTPRRIHTYTLTPSGANQTA